MAQRDVEGMKGSDAECHSVIQSYAGKKVHSSLTMKTQGKKC